MQERTIQLSDDLARLVDDYLQEHPGENLSTLVQDILEIGSSFRSMQWTELDGIKPL